MGLLFKYFFSQVLKKIHWVTVLITGGITLIVTVITLGFSSKAHHPAGAVQIKAANDCQRVVKQIRLSDYNYAKPLILGDVVNESDNMTEIKLNIYNFINSKVANGEIDGASVYIKKLTGGDWFSVNDNEKFSPGSLLYVVTLISTLKQSEHDASLLDKKTLSGIVANKQLNNSADTNIIRSGVQYSTRKLLQSMIISSDDNAGSMLYQMIDKNVYQKVFRDLKLTPPADNLNSYTMKASEYARFFRVLYNATYLNNDNSDYALSLIDKSGSNDALTTQLSKDIPVWDFYGETKNGNQINTNICGIVFMKDNPYVVCVMARGKNITKLNEATGNISKQVYDFIKLKNNSGI